MTILDELERTQFSLRQCVQLLRSVTIAHPGAESPLLEMSKSDSTEPGTRALLKVLLAMGGFAMAQEQTEQAIIAMAEAPRGTTWVN